MKRIAVYAGSFDPITTGHLDLVTRAVSLFDEVVLSIGTNPKKDYFLPMEVRRQVLEECAAPFPNVSVDTFDGLLIDHCRSLGANFILRGLRAVTDFEFEFQMAMMNFHLNPEITSLFMMPDEKFIHLNSTVVKDVAKNGGDVTAFVPQCVREALFAKYSN